MERYPKRNEVKAMERHERSGDEPVEGTDLHPRHASWARISTRNTFIGFVIFLLIAAFFALWIEMRF